MSLPYRPRSDRFLKELQGQAKRTGEINVKVAAQLAGVPRCTVYRLRVSVCGERFREEWDRIRSEAEAKARKK